MPIRVQAFNIPVHSNHLKDVPGKRFNASIYQLSDGTIAAFVELDLEATDEELAAEQMNTKIRQAAKPGSVAFYIMRRR